MPYGKKKAAPPEEPLDESGQADTSAESAPFPPPATPPPEPPSTADLPVGSSATGQSQLSGGYDRELGGGSGSQTPELARSGSRSPASLSRARTPVEGASRSSTPQRVLSPRQDHAGSSSSTSPVSPGRTTSSFLSPPGDDPNRSPSKISSKSIGPRLTSRNSDGSHRVLALPGIPEGSRPEAGDEEQADGDDEDNFGTTPVHETTQAPPLLRARLNLHAENEDDNESERRPSEDAIVAVPQVDSARQTQNMRMAAIARARAEMLAVETAMDEENRIARPTHPRQSWFTVGRRDSPLQDPIFLEEPPAFGSKDWVRYYLASFGIFEMNRPGILPLIFFTSLWVVLASMCLFGTFWIYAFREVRGYELLSAEGAAANARLHTTELLFSAPAVVQAVELAFRAGALQSISDYTTLKLLLAPHFKASPALTRVYLADPSGAVVFIRTPEFQADSALDVKVNFELRSSRQNCGIVGRETCAHAQLNLNETSWYDRVMGLYPTVWWALPLPAFWEGPVFLREEPDEVACVNLCWAPTFAFTARVADGSSVNSNAAAVRQLSTVVVRAEVDARKLQDVAKKAEEFSRGEAFLADKDGELIAASKFGDALIMDDNMGDVRVRKIQELDRHWAPEITSDFVMDASKEGQVIGGVRVSAWVVDGGNSTRGLGSRLRIILAIPQTAFIDPVLNLALIPALVTGVLPFAVIGLWSFASAYQRYCKRTNVNSNNDFDTLLGDTDLEPSHWNEPSVRQTWL